MFRRDRTTCLEFADYSRFSFQHNWGEPVWPHYNEHDNLHFDVKWDSCMSSDNHEENGYGHNLDSLAFIVLHILQEVGAKNKNAQLAHVYLRRSKWQFSFSSKWSHINPAPTQSCYQLNLQWRLQLEHIIQTHDHFFWWSTLLTYKPCHILTTQILVSNSEKLWPHHYVQLRWMTHRITTSLKIRRVKMRKLYEVKVTILVLFERSPSPPNRVKNWT